MAETTTPPKSPSILKQLQDAEKPVHPISGSVPTVELTPEQSAEIANKRLSESREAAVRNSSPKTILDLRN